MQVASISFESQDPRCVCPKCGGHLHRLARKGFLQSGVYPRFGYYPWECFRCSEKRMLRTRGRRPGSHLSGGNIRAESPALSLAPQHESKLFPARSSSPAPKAEVKAPDAGVSPASRTAEPYRRTEEDASPAVKGASPFLLKADEAYPRESASSQVPKVESSELPKSGPLRSRKAEALHSPKGESWPLRKRESSRSPNALPPVSEAAIRRAIFVENSSPETAHSPAAPPVGA